MSRIMGHKAETCWSSCTQYRTQIACQNICRPVCLQGETQLPIYTLNTIKGSNVPNYASVPVVGEETELDPCTTSALSQHCSENKTQAQAVVAEFEGDIVKTFSNITTFLHDSYESATCVKPAL